MWVYICLFVCFGRVCVYRSFSFQLITDMGLTYPHRFKYAYRFTKMFSRWIVQIYRWLRKFRRIGDNFNNIVWDSGKEQGEIYSDKCVLMRISLETILLFCYPSRLRFLLSIGHSCTQMCRPFVIQCPFCTTIWYAIKSTVFSVFLLLLTHRMSHNNWIPTCHIPFQLCHSIFLLQLSINALFSHNEWHCTHNSENIKSTECYKKIENGKRICQNWETKCMNTLFTLMSVVEMLRITFNKCMVCIRVDVLECLVWRFVQKSYWIASTQPVFHTASRNEQNSFRCWRTEEIKRITHKNL